MNIPSNCSNCNALFESYLDIKQSTTPPGWECRSCGQFHPDNSAVIIGAKVKKSPVVQILEECIELHDAKSSDYDHPTKHDGLANFRVAEELAVPAWIGALIRLQDKNERIKTLVYKLQTTGEGPAVKDETIEDTLRDAINYNAIVLALYREHKARKG